MWCLERFRAEPLSDTRLVRGGHSTVSAMSPGGWPQAFVAKFRSQIQTENQRQDQDGTTQKP